MKLNKMLLIGFASLGLMVSGCASNKHDLSTIEAQKAQQAAAAKAAAEEKAAADAQAAEEARVEAEAKAQAQADAEMAAAKALKPAMNSVYFAFDSAVLDSSASGTLEAYATWLANNADVNVTIEGNCDQRGSREYNLALGQQRADSVKAFFVARGVDAARLDTVSFGEERPVCMGSGEACWAQNRHADIVSR